MSRERQSYEFKLPDGRILRLIENRKLQNFQITLLSGKTRIFTSTIFTENANFIARNANLINSDAKHSKKGD
jgi:hypothetical protein